MTAHAGPLPSSTLSIAAARAAVALLVAAAAVAVLTVRRRLPPRVLARAREAAWFALGLTVVVVAASGGARSIAVPVLGLAVWGLVAAAGWREGAGGAAGALLVLGIRALVVHEPAVELIAPAGVVGFLGFLPPLFGRQLALMLDREPRLPRRVEAQLRRDSGDVAAGVPRRPRDSDSFYMQEDSLDQDRLVELLRDLRDLTGADEAILWEWVEHRNRLIPSGWSTEDARRPMYFRVQEWAPLVRWTGEELRVQLDGAGERPEFAAAPVATSDQFFGVLTLTSGVGLELTRDQARSWLPRYGRQVANLLELADLRHEYSRQYHDNQSLLEQMNRLQEHKRFDELAPELCRSVLEVTARPAHAALVRWLPEESRGFVQYATEGAGVEAGAPVPEDSLVGGACRSGLKLVVEDARVASTAHSLYGGKGGQRPVPSLAVIPLKHDRRVIGAIVVEGMEPGAVTREIGQRLALLAGSVHGSLEIIWEIEEVNRRARTDALTGLWNRRHFDEHLKTEVARTNRSGSPCSLVLVDIDHFKQVNDTFGHDAGDAVLRQVAKALQDAVRQMDVCSRYGGEEMAILLPETGVAGASELAERLRAAIAGREMRHGSTPLQVTASFGVASFPETVAQGDALFGAADKALYAAKSAGRNCVKVAPARAAKPAP